MLSEDELKVKAKKLIKQVLLDRDVNFTEASKIMSNAGYNYTPAAFRQRIQRGNVELFFLLQFADAFDMDVELVKKKFN